MGIKEIYLERCKKYIDDGYYKTCNFSRGVTTLLPLLVRVSTFSDESGQMTFAELPKAAFSAVDIGYSFGPSWSVHWFKVVAPSHQQDYVIEWETGCEGLLFEEDGTIVSGLSEQRKHIHVPKGGAVFYIQATCNGMFGNGSGSIIGPPNPANKFAITKCSAVLIDQARLDLVRDVKLLIDLYETLPSDLAARNEALFVANEVVNTEAEGLIAAYLAKHRLQSPFKVYAVGNCHIDTAWLWDIDQTRLKTARSWSSQLGLLDKFHDYRFACSQMQQLDWLRQDFPELFSRVQAAAAKGRFLVLGGCWVEMDGNMPSGEAVIRQFFYGQHFASEHFGRISPIFWLPDTFGYNAQLPQLALKGGCRYFVSQKLSWNNINAFDLSSFWWQGIDGSKLLAHFPPANTYTASASVEDVWRSMANNKQNDRSNVSLLLYGFGDGGGGPTEEMIARLLRADSIAGLPAIVHGTPEEFFGELGQAKKLPTWTGEMYLEFHRGTFTSQAATKKSNRRLEQQLRIVELLSVIRCLQDGAAYPHETIDGLWKDLLTMQFHDILPGSSIGKVYRDAAETYAGIESGCKKLLDTTPASPLYNPTGVSRYDLIDGKVWRSDPFSPSRVVDFAEGPKIARNSDCYSLSNSKVECKFALDGTLLALYNKQTGKFATVDASRFMLYEDMPLRWDAWDVEIYTKEKGKEVRGTVLGHFNEAQIAGLDLKLEISPTSWAEVRISLASFDAKISYHVKVGWDEAHKLFCVEFPVNVLSDTASFECPFGITQRRTSQNTTWEQAKFESCGHRFADLSETGSGVALINDSKYGYSVVGSTITLSLLRAPKRPDDACDLGKHEFSFSLLSHDGNLARVVDEATAFNCALVRTRTAFSDSLFSTDSAFVKVETIKMKNSSSRALIVRLYESVGSRGLLNLAISKFIRVDYVYKCSDYLEMADSKLDKIAPKADGTYPIDFTPFEVITLQIDFSS